MGYCAVHLCVTFRTLKTIPYRGYVGVEYLIEEQWF